MGAAITVEVTSTVISITSCGTVNKILGNKVRRETKIEFCKVIDGCVEARVYDIKKVGD